MNCNHTKTERLGTQLDSEGRSHHLANCKACGSTVTIPDHKTESWKKIMLYGEPLIHYRFVTPEGKLFTCVSFTLAGARHQRDEWLKEEE